MRPSADPGSSEPGLVSAPERAWYAVCRSRRLRRRPRAVTLLDRPLVLFRGADGAPAALVDRCPHRNVPLSLGSVRGRELECAYHGWRFDAAGVCRFVPGLPEQHRSPARAVPAHAACERDGLVWVWGVEGDVPDRDPFRFPHLGDPAYCTLRSSLHAEASLLDVAENAMDVPHTAYLHGGLFRKRGGTRHPIEVIVRRWSDRVEAEYRGEPRPPGLVARFLAPGGGTVTHFDRFVLPSIVQVEYGLGEETHWCATAALTPVSARHTVLHAAISYRLPVPGWLVAPVLAPLSLKVFRQDAGMLRRQTENLRKFGGEDYRSTAVDLLGPPIHRLLRNARSGRASPGADEPVVRTVSMTT
jgi:phenylpropionate dioxygenase-like ring-hydroxylating dioxygenase large terminal subunit